jgi:hypothetical protein
MDVMSGQVLRYAGKKGTDENTIENPYYVVPGKMMTVKDIYNLNIPAFSLNFYTFNISNIALQTNLSK